MSTWSRCWWCRWRWSRRSRWEHTTPCTGCSSNHLQKAQTIPNGSCVTIDARVVEELVALMVGSWCSEDGEGGDKENGEGEFCTHPPPPPFSGGCLREGSPVHTKGAVYCCRVKKKWALQVSVMFLLTSAGYRHTNFWQKLPLLVIFYYRDPQNSPPQLPHFFTLVKCLFFSAYTSATKKCKSSSRLGGDAILHVVRSIRRHESCLLIRAL